MKNPRNLFAVVLMSALALSGCSNKTEDSIVIGMECNYAPFNWTATSASDYTLPIFNDAGKYADGYDIQFAKRLSSELNKKVTIMKLEWDNLIISLNNKTIDAVIAGMTDTEERRQSIDFTDEYYRSELVLITKKAVSDEYDGKQLDATDMTEVLNGKNIESQRGTVTDDVIETFKTNYGAIHSLAVDTFAKAAADVHTGAAFAMTAELPVAQSIVKNYSDLGIVHMNQEILGVDLSDLGVSIGIRKGDEETKKSFNKVLSGFKKEERDEMMLQAVERSGE